MTTPSLKFRPDAPGLWIMIVDGECGSSMAIVGVQLDEHGRFRATAIPTSGTRTTYYGPIDIPEKEARMALKWEPPPGWPNEESPDRPR